MLIGNSQLISRADPRRKPSPSLIMVGGPPQGSASGQISPHRALTNPSPTLPTVTVQNAACGSEGKSTSVNGLSTLQMRGLPHIFQGLLSHHCVGAVGAISPEWLFAARDGSGLLPQRAHSHIQSLYIHKKMKLNTQEAVK